MREAIMDVLQKEGFTVVTAGDLSEAVYEEAEPFVSFFHAGLARGRLGSFRRLSLCVYAKAQHPVLLEEACLKIVKILHKKELVNRRGAVFVLEYAKDAGDFIDDDIGRVYRILEFVSPCLL